MTRFLRRMLVAGTLVGAGAACGGGDEEGLDGAADSAAALDGLSRDQIELRAEPMSPEEAELLGIIDTVIHLENLNDSDTLFIPDTVGMGARDSVR